MTIEIGELSKHLEERLKWLNRPVLGSVGNNISTYANRDGGIQELEVIARKFGINLSSQPDSEVQKPK